MTKLLFRRWYFSLPMLLVTLVLVGVAAVTVKPDYSATGHIQFIPPVGTVAKDGSKNPIDNPWWELGFEALANATVIDVTKKSALEGMVARGLSDNITVTIDQVPLFVIEAVGDSSQQATATVQFVQKAIADAVAQRQENLRVADTELIKMIKLDDGSEVEVKNSKIMRVMVVAFGLGLLLMAAATIGIDALLRARARRRANESDPAPGAAVGSASSDGRGTASGNSGNSGSLGNSGSPGNQVPPSFEATQTIPAPTRHPTGPPDQGRDNKAEQQRRRGNGAAPAQRRPSDGTAYRSQQSTGGTAPDPRLEQAPADATIVLPPWGTKRDEKAERR